VSIAITAIVWGQLAATFLGSGVVLVDDLEIQAERPGLHPFEPPQLVRGGLPHLVRHHHVAGDEKGRAASGDEKGKVEILVDDAQVSFRAGGLTLTSRLIEGEFPNYRQLLPDTHESRLTVSRQQLLDAVRRVGLLARDTTPVRLEFNALGVKLSSSSPDLGQAVETVEARYEGDDLTVAFNPQYLIDGLTAAIGESVRLDVRDGLKPGVVHGESDGFTYLVMPVRLPAAVV